MGAGLKSSMARMSDSASRERWPPLSSLRLCFHTSPNPTCITRKLDCPLSDCLTVKTLQVSDSAITRKQCMQYLGEDIHGLCMHPISCQPTTREQEASMWGLGLHLSKCCMLATQQDSLAAWREQLIASCYHPMWYLPRADTDTAGGRDGKGLAWGKQGAW